MRVRRLAVIFVLLLLSIIVAAGGFSALLIGSQIDRQIKERNIELIDWRLAELDNQTLGIEKLEFRYQDRYLIKLLGLKVSSEAGFVNAVTESQSKDLLSKRQSIDKLSIEQLQIRVINGEVAASASESTFHFSRLVDSLKQQLAALSQSPVLALVPSEIEIKHASFITACPAGECELQATLQLKAATTRDQLRLQLSLDGKDSAIPTVELQSQSQLRVPFHSGSPPFEFSINSRLKSAQTVQNDDLAISVVLTGRSLEEQGKNFLQISSKVHGQLPRMQTAKDSRRELTDEWFGLLKLYNRWSPKPLVEEELVAQLSPFFPIDWYAEEVKDVGGDFELIEEGKLDLDRFVATDTDSDLLRQVDLSSDVSLKINRPISLSGVASVHGNIQGSFTLKNGKIKHYAVKTDGIAEQLNKPDWLSAQGWKFNALHFTLQSAQQDLDEPLRQLPFQLSVVSLLEESGAVSPQNEKLSLQSNGVILFNESPTVELGEAKLNLQNAHLNLTPQQRLIDFKSDIRLSGRLNSKAAAIKVHQANLSGQLKKGKQSLKIRKLQLEAFQVAIDDIQQALKVLDIHGEKLRFDADFRNPEVALEGVNLTLRKIRLQAPQQETKPFKQFTAQYQGQVKNIKHSQLHPQSWSAKGKITAQVATSLDSLKSARLNGQLANAAGIQVEHVVDYQPRTLQATWKLADQYFLVGNPFSETFVSWPKLLSASAGKLSAKGRFQLALRGMSSSTDFRKYLQNFLSAQSDITLSGIDGIYNETEFKKLNLDSRLHLTKGCVQTRIEKLDVEEANHGLIVGPIEVVAEMRTPLFDWQATEVDLQKAEVQVFDGKARLAPRVLQLNQPVSAELLLDNINLQALLQQYPSSEIQGTGLLQGRLPFSLDLSNRSNKKPVFFIADGRLYASEPGGVLQYQADSSALKQTHKSMELALNLLEDFHYKVLDSRISLDENQKLHLKLRLQGNNPKVERGRQVNFNIQIEEDLPALITSMQISSQISNTIQKRIQEKLQNRLNSNQ
ncbi:YdbH domain-containing protein [Thiomicrorhabdus sp.]|uniref:YdbH domain-containing protein n=1 Tax=Thiomicrorhabdus sp. TaxID=2039724 RepID=UPI0029C8D264|nr:YdbH domain-containing protein [Thiomicrorhabdus sp.]